MRPRQVSRIVDLAGDVEELCAQLARRLQLPPHKVKAIQSKHDLKLVCRIAALRAQYARPGIGGLDLRCAVAAGEDQGDAQGQQQFQLQPVTVRALGLRMEQL